MKIIEIKRLRKKTEVKIQKNKKVKKTKQNKINHSMKLKNIYISALGHHTPVPESLLIKLQAEACNFIQKETLAQKLSWEFCEISKNTCFTEHLQETASLSKKNHSIKKN